MDKFIYMLAPFEDISGPALRALCYRHGADCTFTEMTRIDGLARNNRSTWEKISICDGVPTYIQLIGTKEAQLEKFLSAFSPQKGFCGFNLNLGCPSPEMISIGTGCALIKRITKTQTLVKTIQDHGYECSIKLRLGMNNLEKERKVYLNLIDAVDASFFVVHARHGMQTENDPADFSVYEGCVRLGKPIIANGDIKSREQIDYLKSIGVSGAMIGRAAVADPGIFDRLKGVPTPDLAALSEEYAGLAVEYGASYRYINNVLKMIWPNMRIPMALKERLMHSPLSKREDHDQIKILKYDGF